jgi:hypothetical protein
MRGVGGREGMCICTYCVSLSLFVRRFQVCAYCVPLCVRESLSLSLSLSLSMSLSLPVRRFQVCANRRLQALAQRHVYTTQHVECNEIHHVYFNEMLSTT